VAGECSIPIEPLKSFVRLCPPTPALVTGDAGESLVTGSYASQAARGAVEGSDAKLIIGVSLAAVLVSGRFA
jgi:hypothetical protein